MSRLKRYSPHLAGIVGIAAAAWLTGACNHAISFNSSHARLFAGMGSLHHPIATASPQAQRFFDQGLASVYAFNFGEAINSFQRATELDPDAPMPYWGLALAYGPNYNAWIISPDRERRGFDAIQTAAGLAAHAAEPERAYIDALAHGFSDAPKTDQAQLARDYSSAMRDVYRRYPDDPDAAVLFAASLMNLHPWHLWQPDGAAGPDTAETIAVLEEALRRWPQHTGANHFYIHAMEASNHPERALASAQRLETLAPAAAHLVHMPSHIYLRVGDYDAAVRSNQHAIRVDRSYRLEQPDMPAGVMGYANHNQQFLAVAAALEGDFETAMTAAQEIAHMHSEAMAVMPSLVLMRFARWDDILRSPAPNPDLHAARFFWRLARGSAYASERRLKDAAAEQAAMEQAFTLLPAGRAFGSFFNDWSTLHSLAAGTLSARIAAARGDPEAAIAHWRDAIAIQDQMNPDDLPDWYYPVRESLGAALLANKEAADAENVFRQDLERNPRNPRSLFGLYKSLEAQKKSYDADLVRESFEAVWKGKQLPRLEDF